MVAGPAITCRQTGHSNFVWRFEPEDNLTISSEHALRRLVAVDGNARPSPECSLGEEPGIRLGKALSATARDHHESYRPFEERNSEQGIHRDHDRALDAREHSSLGRRL